MKRIYWKELVLVSVPMLVVGLVFLGSRWRQQKDKSTQPHIESCQIRPATPLEISQGADIGFTAIAVAPDKPFPCAGLDYSLFDEQGRSLDYKQPVWREGHSHSQDQLSKFEENRAYSWSNQVFWQHPIFAEVRLKSACRGWSPIKQRFKLTTQGLMIPNPIFARRSNFRVTKATLQYDEFNGKAAQHQNVSLSLSDVSDESQGLMTTPYCVGKWYWRGDKQHFFYALPGSWVGRGAQLSLVEIMLDAKGMRMPPSKGTTIRGLLSINRGWPQEITLQWPEQLRSEGRPTELKFSTRLAPLPSPKQIIPNFVRPRELW